MIKKNDNIKHPIKLRGHVQEDTWCYDMIFAQGDYDFTHLVDFPVEYVLDAGAYFGGFSIIMANRYPMSKILALEPDPENYWLAKDNLDLYPESVTLWHNALLDTSENVYIGNPHKNGKWGMMVASEKQTSASTPVKSTTVNEVLQLTRWPRLDIVKIDIEGAELRVFQGDCKWLKKTKMLVIELHEWAAPGCEAALYAAIKKQKLTHETHKIGENLVIKLVRSDDKK